MTVVRVGPGRDADRGAAGRAGPPGRPRPAPVDPGSSESSRRAVRAELRPAGRPGRRARRRTRTEDRAGAPGPLPGPRPPPSSGPRRAQQRAADAAQRGRGAWDSHGRPNKMIIVRPTSVDSLTNGQLTRRAPRRGRRADAWPAWTAPCPVGWITSADGTVQLAAAVVLSPGVTLELGGGGVTTVAAGRRTDRRRRRVDLHRRRPAERARRHGDLDRPGLRAAGRRRPRTALRARDRGRPAGRHRRHLQRPRHPARPTRRTGPASRSAPAAPAPWCAPRCCATAPVCGSTDRPGCGWRALTVAESAADGLMLQGDQGTTLIGVRAERNERQRGAGQRARARRGRSPASAPPATASSGWPW